MDSVEAYKKAGREPQKNEMLSVSLDFASHGVTGFIIFHYQDMLASPVKEWIPKRWEAMKNISKAPAVAGTVHHVRRPHHRDQT